MPSLRDGKSTSTVPVQGEILAAVQHAHLSPTKAEGLNTVNITPNQLAEVLDSIKSLKISIDQHRDTVDLKINELSEKMDAKMKQLGDTLQATFTEKIADIQHYVDSEIGRIVTRIDTVEGQVNGIQNIVKPPFDPEVTVVATGVEFRDGEDILETSTTMIRRGLNLQNVPVVNAQRLQGRGRRPGIVKIELKSLDDKKAVLRAKAELKQTEQWKSVYLRSSRTHLERLHDINMRTVLNMIPGGENMIITGSGRVVKKDENRGPRFPQAHPPTPNQPPRSPPQLTPQGAQGGAPLTAP